MKSKSNPLQPIDAIANFPWTCPSPYAGHFSTTDAFYKKFDKSSRCLLAEGGQSNIYTFTTTNRYHSASSGAASSSSASCKRADVVIAKEYNVARHKNALQDAWTEYVLVKRANLLLYDELYFDEKAQLMTIVSEPLNYTLRDYVEVQCKDRSITEKECKVIVLDIMDKLWTCHKCGFLHNDINPDNIMYRSDERESDSISPGWKLIDFGLIMSIQACKHNRYKYKGTRGWTPPECRIDSTQNKYTIGRDIWSLGLIILYILLKQQPYTLTYHEQQDICGGDRSEYKRYFYYHKLLQLPYQKKKKQKKHENGVADCSEIPNKLMRMMIKFTKNPYKKNKAKTKAKAKMKPQMKDDTKAETVEMKHGEAYLKKYLVDLYREKKISYDLCNLLINHMLTFDPEQRASCDEIYAHPWFSDVRHL